jgi:hypothetical protein
MGTRVLLDTLEWGPAASSTTNTLGHYSLDYLPPGSYRVQVTAPPNHVVTTPIGGIAVVTVSPGSPAGGVNFGIRMEGNLWHNAAAPLNVNNDGEGDIAPIDALLVINWINAHPNDPLLPLSGSPASAGFVDVNNDNECTPIDALLVINYLNGAGGSSEGETSDGAGGATTLPSGLAGSGPASEGEQSAAPTSAAAYYAQNPVHFAQIAGDEEACDHDHDEGSQVEASLPSALASDSGDIALPAAGSQSGGSMLLELPETGDSAETQTMRQYPGRRAASLAELRRTPLALLLSSAARKEQDDDLPRLDASIDSIAADVDAAWTATTDKRRRP